MTSHTRAMRTIPLWSIVAAILWFAGTAPAQGLRGEALAKALQKGGYVLVMRHASSPRDVPDKQTANADNNKPERQLDEAGRKSAVAMGKALRDLRIPIGNVLSSPTYRALETVRLAQLGTPPCSSVGVFSFGVSLKVSTHRTFGSLQIGLLLPKQKILCVA